MKKGILVSCTMSLFVSILSKDLGLVLTWDNLNHAAKLTFLSIMLLSVLFTAIDVVGRKLTTEKITGHITAATRELVQGNLAIRIALVKRVVDILHGEISVESTIGKGTTFTVRIRRA